MRLVVAVGMIVMGLGIAGLWTRDVIAGDKVDLSRGVLRAREEDDSLLWPHWLAEYGTALVLVIGGLGLIARADWSVAAAAGGLGALLYTSVNSLGWALAKPERSAYAIPMTAGAIVGVLGLTWLIA